MRSARAGYPGHPLTLLRRCLVNRGKIGRQAAPAAWRSYIATREPEVVKSPSRRPLRQASLSLCGKLGPAWLRSHVYVLSRPYLSPIPQKSHQTIPVSSAPHPAPILYSTHHVHDAWFHAVCSAADGHVPRRKHNSKSAGAPYRQLALFRMEKCCFKSLAHQQVRNV